MPGGHDNASPPPAHSAVTIPEEADTAEIVSDDTQAAEADN